MSAAGAKKRPRRVLTTGFTRLTGCRVPLQLAGMGGMTSEPLVSAVAASGALGMVGAASTPAPTLLAQISAIRETSPNGRLGINFLMPFLDIATLEQVASEVDLVEFFFDAPRADLVSRVHAAGALAGWQIGSPEEARKAIDSGCDLIVAQGVEAGGHVRGTWPLLVLLDRVLSFAEVPVVAAGAPATGKGLAAVLAGGAAGLRVGTRFLTALESVAHPQYIEALLRARCDDAVYTTAFANGWPGAPHRVLKCALDAAHAAGDGPVASTEQGGQRVDVPRFNVLPPDVTAKGNVAAMCMYAGQSVEAVVRRQSASEIVAEIVGEAAHLLDTPGED